MTPLDLDDLRSIGRLVLGGELQVRDWGLLESALARPFTTVFGEAAYPTPWSAAAALLHSLVRNHALVDGNKRLGITACALFLHRNGYALALDEDEAYDLVIGVAEGRIDVPEIAVALQRWGT